MKKRLPALLLALFLLVPPLSLRAGAAIATDSITVRVGYVGGPYYEKASFNWRELDDMYDGALATHELLYSYCSGSRTALCAARGFLLTDLLELAGVDLSGVTELSFWTDDQSVSAWTSFQKEELLDRPRYYFPNLSADEDGTLRPLHGGELEDGAQRVDCMLALEDNWEWDARSDVFSQRGFDFMSATGRFHLLFGQTEPGEARTMQAAKYVHTIDVTFAGRPVFDFESNLDLKVGQDFRVQLNVAAADSLLEDNLRDTLVWSSNNSEVVEADLYGKLVPKAPGEAVISAVIGDETISVTVRVGEGGGAGISAGESETPPDTGAAAENEPPGGEERPPEEPPAGPEEEEKAEYAPETAPEAESGTEPETEPERESEEPPEPETESAEVAYSENDAGVYILSSRLMAETEYAEWVNSILEHDVPVDSDEGDVMNWREQAPAEDAVQLRLVRPDEKSTAPVTAAAFALLFMSGAGWGAVSAYFHRREKIR